MNKELKEEAEYNADKWIKCAIDHKSLTYWNSYVDGYIASAEPREKHIAELEKENAELKDKLNNLSKVAEVRLANWQKYEEENKELKERNNKAKELLEDLIKFQPYIDREAFFISLGNEWKTAIYRAEQFLMEIKENDL